MFIEAVDHPIRYRFPGGEIRLEPGRPVEVEPERAAKLLARAGAKVRAVMPVMRPGDRITWDRAGSVQTGLINFIHVDVDGTAWAFVTLRETWAAVNCKFVKAVTV